MRFWKKTRSYFCKTRGPRRSLCQKGQKEERTACTCCIHTETKLKRSVSTSLPIYCSIYLQIPQLKHWQTGAISNRSRSQIGTGTVDSYSKTISISGLPSSIRAEAPCCVWAECSSTVNCNLITIWFNRVSSWRWPLTRTWLMLASLPSVLPYISAIKLAGEKIVQMAKGSAKKKSSFYLSLTLVKYHSLLCRGSLFLLGPASQHSRYDHK